MNADVARLRSELQQAHAERDSTQLGVASLRTQLADVRAMLDRERELAQSHGSTRDAALAALRAEVLKLDWCCFV